jgi:DNA-binding response OmpR family regulator
MPHTLLTGLRLLLVQDDAIVGPMLAGVLEAQGAVVDGPWSSLRLAMGAMHHHPPEAAILDVTLHDGTTYGLAASLQSMGISYAFLSASDPTDIPAGLLPFAVVQKHASTMAVLALAHRLSNDR